MEVLDGLIKLPFVEPCIGIGMIQSTNWFKLLLPKVKPIVDNEMLNDDEKMRTRGHRTQVGDGCVKEMDGEAVVEDERTKLYSKGNNFF